MSDPAAAVLANAREALRGTRAWLVGGAVRDQLLGRPAGADLDLVIDGPVDAAARAFARSARATAFPLSDQHGGWRVVGRPPSWQADLNPLRGGSIDADLRLRDFTVNAIARPLEGEELVDPLGGAADLAAGRLRLAAPQAIEADPLRALRLARLACELELMPDADARAAAARAAPGLANVAGERIYGELARILASERPSLGVRLAIEVGAAAVALPELVALDGVTQSRYHHLDVLEHTLAVLDQTVAIERDPAAALGAEHGPTVRALLGEPLADGLTRGTALRFGALLHDIAKPGTRAVADDGRVTFPHHDERGAATAAAVLARLHAAGAMRAHVAALVRAHLQLGWLVDEGALARRSLYRYLDTCDPVPADVTVLSAADRLATRGRGSDEAIARHLARAREVLGEALRWQRDGRPRPLVRGDELVRALGLEPGPLIGELLAAIEEEAFAGELESAEDALAFAAARIA
jgi:poly(A) polymerase